MALQSVIAGRAYVLGDNIDTDQIIPAQYLTFNPAIPEEHRQFGEVAPILEAGGVFPYARKVGMLKA